MAKEVQPKAPFSISEKPETDRLVIQWALEKKKNAQDALSKVENDPDFLRKKEAEERVREADEVKSTIERAEAKKRESERLAEEKERLEKEAAEKKRLADEEAEAKEKAAKEVQALQAMQEVQRLNTRLTAFEATDLRQATEELGRLGVTGVGFDQARDLFHLAQERLDEISKDPSVIEAVAKVDQAKDRLRDVINDLHALRDPKNKLEEKVIVTGEEAKTYRIEAERKKAKEKLDQLNSFAEEAERMSTEDLETYYSVLQDFSNEAVADSTHRADIRIEVKDFWDGKNTEFEEEDIKRMQEDLLIERSKVNSLDPVAKHEADEKIAELEVKIDRRLAKPIGVLIHEWRSLSSSSSKDQKDQRKNIEDQLFGRMSVIRDYLKVYYLEKSSPLKTVSGRTYLDKWNSELRQTTDRAEAKKRIDDILKLAGHFDTEEKRKQLKIPSEVWDDMNNKVGLKTLLGEAQKASVLLGTSGRVDLDDIKKNVKDLIITIKPYCSSETARVIPERDQSNLIKNPRSIQEFMMAVASRVDPKWRVNGEQELITKEGEVKVGNLIAYVRDRLMYERGLNPDSNIDVKMPMSELSGGEGRSLLGYVLGNAGIPLWLEEKEQIVLERDEDTGEFVSKIQRMVSKEDKYEKVKDALFMESWLFTVEHERAYTIKRNLPSPEKLASAMQGLLFRSKMTDEARIVEVIMKMQSTNSSDKDTLSPLEQEWMRYGRNVHEGAVGTGFRAGMGALNYIWAIAAKEKSTNWGGGKDDVFLESGTKNPFDAMLGEKGMPEFYNSVLKTIIAEHMQTQLGRDLQNSDSPELIIDGIPLVNANEDVLYDSGADKITDWTKTTDILAHIAKVHGGQGEEDWLYKLFKTQEDRNVFFNRYVLPGLNKQMRKKKERDLTFQEIEQRRKVMDGLKEVTSPKARKEAVVMLMSGLAGLEHTALNIYKEKQVPNAQRDMFWRAMRSAVVAQHGLKSYEAAYAMEHVVMWEHLSGASTWADTGSAAFNGQVKLVRGEYEDKSREGARTAGLDMQKIAIRRLMDTYFNTINVSIDGSKEVPLQNILQGGSFKGGNDIYVVNGQLNDHTFDIKLGAEDNFADTSWNRASQVFAQFESPIDWTSVFDNDPYYGTLVFNEGKATEMAERYKAVRYLYDSNGRVWNANTIAYHPEEYRDPETGKIKRRLVAKQKTLGEATFDDEIIKLYNGFREADGERDGNGKPFKGVELNSKEVKVSQAVLGYIVAKDIQAARDPKNPRKWVTMTEVRRLGEFFSNIPLESYVDESSGKRLVRVNKGLFGTQRWKKVMGEAGIDVNSENAKELGITMAYILWILMGNLTNVSNTASKVFSS